MRSFVKVLNAAGCLLETCPSAALKSLSETCRSRRISLSVRESGSSLRQSLQMYPNFAVKTWPQIRMVVCTGDEGLKSYLLPQWGYMMQVMMVSLILRVSAPPAISKTVVLIDPCQQLGCPINNLPRQHCAALSQFAGTHKRITARLCLRGPFVGTHRDPVLHAACWSLLSQTHFSMADSPLLEDPKSVSGLGSLHSVKAITVTDCCPDAALLMQL